MSFTGLIYYQSGQASGLVIARTVESTASSSSVEGTLSTPELSCRIESATSMSARTFTVSGEATSPTLGTSK